MFEKFLASGVFWLLLVIIGIAIILIAVYIYKYFYNKRINRVLNEFINKDDIEDESKDEYNTKYKANSNEEYKSRKSMPSPGSIAKVGIIFVLSILFILFILNVYGMNNATTSDYQDNTIIEYKTYTSEQIKNTAYEQYVSAYYNKKLTGYSVIEKEEDDIKYMLFISEGEYTSLHPAFIMFVSYAGEDEIKYYMDENKICFNEERNVTTGGMGMASEYYCIIGNMNFDNISHFIYKISLYSDGNIENIKEMDGQVAPVSEIEILVRK